VGSKSKDKSKLTAAEMKFMRKAAKYTWRDYKTNVEILTFKLLAFRY
jgi:hypothetical protein